MYLEVGDFLNVYNYIVTELITFGQIMFYNIQHGYYEKSFDILQDNLWNLAQHNLHHRT
jgi:hypothetical protein